MHRHPNISAWHREEDGSYQSEVSGLTVHVTWRPESRDPLKPRGFSWRVESPDGRKAESEGVVEEIEAAMSLGEDAARHLAAASSEASSSS
jgi:hypothetical protein